MEYKDPGRYIPIIYLLYSWGSQFGASSRVPLFLLANHLQGKHGSHEAETFAHFFSEAMKEQETGPKP